MATREENLKKINPELEKLSDEELEQVAGGDECEKYDDYHFLGKSGLLLDEYNTFDPYAFQENEMLERGWARVGIKCIHDDDKPNQYFLNGKPISRDDAIKHAQDFVSSHWIPIDPYHR